MGSTLCLSVLLKLSYAHPHSNNPALPHGSARDLGTLSTGDIASRECCRSCLSTHQQATLHTGNREKEPRSNEVARSLRFVAGPHLADSLQPERPKEVEHEVDQRLWDAWEVGIHMDKQGTHGLRLAPGPPNNHRGEWRDI